MKAGSRIDRLLSRFDVRLMPSCGRRSAMESDWERAGQAPPANDNAGQAGRIDPRLLVIAWAIGRQIARELLRAEAANDNRPNVSDQGRDEI
ncbi:MULTISPECIES: hypothetical protein [Inquilinus]|uniref:Uncharacterized protein n=1 Tax=Inquilinus ginsengisoli TaxID=363840 RepID=A0ABU1JK67_9PROT|nr:hypothetical protein [Inquilinus ginsengisoli]MDR6289011.1 hypothetical protein [Inquilinus ginsengisoli]